LPVPVHVLADELANIGTINDLTKKISTIRSRRISMSVIFQNIAQMKNRYPNDAWLEVIGNCDCQLFLGCTDEMTAKFISDRTGEVTIGVESAAKELRSIRLGNYVPSHRETSSIGKRKLLTPDEVLRLPRDDALVIFRGQKVLKVKKFDYTKHPEAKKIRECNARDYIPNWRMDQGESRVAAEKAITAVKAVKCRAKETPHPTTQASEPISEPVPKPGRLPLFEPEPASISSPTPVAPPKRKNNKKPEHKSVLEELDLNSDEPFGAIDIDDLLSDL